MHIQILLEILLVHTVMLVTSLQDLTTVTLLAALVAIHAQLEHTMIKQLKYHV